MPDDAPGDTLPIQGLMTALGFRNNAPILPRLESPAGIYNVLCASDVAAVVGDEVHDGI